MKDTTLQLKDAIRDAGLDLSCLSDIHTNPSGLPSAWMQLASPQEVPAITSALKDQGGRLATTTVFRADTTEGPVHHTIIYHMILGGMPIAISLDLHEGEALPSIARMFPNADWEERELMELGGIEVTGHPDPRRLLLDESIDAGVLDRLVPYSEMTNSVDHEAVWQRIKDESCEAQKRRQERLDREKEAGQ